jgi:hypothetical protein
MLSISEEERELYSEAMQNWKEGRLGVALSSMTESVDRSQGDPRVLGTFCSLRGGIHKDLGDVNAARRDFKVSVMMKPKSRLASALYYNFLVESGQMLEANEEGLRYLKAIEDSAELTDDTRSYVDIILLNLGEVPGWSRYLQAEATEVIKKRWKQLYDCEWAPDLEGI